jgi:hypothetical protein
LQRPEVRPLSLQPLDDFQEVGERAGKPVDPHDNQSIASPQLIQHTRQNKLGATAAGGLVFG